MSNMFQRFKGFNFENLLDPTLAEEQNKKEQQTGKASAVKRSTSTNAGIRRNATRTASPSKSGGSHLAAPETGDTNPGKAPDPEEFVIGDDVSDLSRVGTPRPRTDKEVGKEQEVVQDALSSNNKGKEKIEKSNGLPEDVHKKLARLEQLTAKYQDLLRNYRSAHKRIQAVEPFEAMLREHTTLNSILDPGAFDEFYKAQEKEKKMMMDELRRVTDENDKNVKERNGLQTKLEQSEIETQKASQEAADSRKEGDENSMSVSEPAAVEAKASTQDTGTGNVEEKAKNTEEVTKEDEFFSYETEQQKNIEEQIEHYESEIQGHKEYITELLTDNAGLNHQLELCQLNLSAMDNKITIKDREITSIQDELSICTEKLQTEVHTAQSSGHYESQIAELKGRLNTQQESQDDITRDLKSRTVAAETAAFAAEASLKNYKAEHEKSSRTGRSVQLEEKGLQNLRGLIGTLREQISNLEISRTEKEAESKDLQFAVKRLEAESNNSDNIISSLRGHEAAAGTLKKKLAEVENERDAAQRMADSKKGHETAVASLRSQLKRAEKDRDTAYQLIIDCGRCEKPAGDVEKTSEILSEENSVTGSRSRRGSASTLHTGASIQPTEVSGSATPIADDGDGLAGDAKKKSNKKKKSKSKKASSEKSIAPVPTIEELMNNPSQAVEMLQNSGESKQASMLEFITKMLKEISEGRKQDELKEDSLEELRQHLEETIEKRDQIIRQYTHEINTLTEMNSRQDQFVKAKTKEIEVLKLAIAEKESAIESLNVKWEAGQEHARRHPAVDEGMSRKVEELETEVRNKQLTIDDKEAAIERLDAKIKDQDGLTEEIEDLRESLLERAGDLNKIQNLKEATEKAAKEHQDLLEEHKQQSRKHKTQQDALREEIATLTVDRNAFEKQIQELKSSDSASDARMEQDRQQHKKELENAKEKSAELEAQVRDMSTRLNSLTPELESTSTLAKERYQKVIDLQKHCNDVLLPKIKKLEEENAEIKTKKVESEKAMIAVKKLEGRERDLKSEIAEYKSQVMEKNRAVAELKDSAKKSQERNSALEESYENARKDLEKSQSTRDEAMESRDKLQAELKGVEQEHKQSKSRLEELDRQVKTFSGEASSLRDELQLKSAQHASSQSNMDNMQDQTRELATQMKEAHERNASLEDELADAHRLLSERSREAETMRRLLNEVEGKAESRVKEMRERMDLAIEERDRAEDEASSIGRRKAREVEDFKVKLREAERELSRAIEAREDAEKRESDFQARGAKFERSVALTQEELTEVRAAMAQLRDALDESERQTHDLEKERNEIRKLLQERETRLDKLQKSSKVMTEELRNLQATNKLRQSSVQSSSRSSMDTMSPRVSSPSPKTAFTNGKAPEVDTMYLKNILLQFLEQKEKKHQLQLVHVLGQLLHFSKQEEQKWQSVISAR